MKYKDQIRRAILNRIYWMRHIHKRDIKTAIDAIKNEYLWKGTISLEDLQSIISYFKENWAELKEQAKSMRRLYQVQAQP